MAAFAGARMLAHAAESAELALGIGLLGDFFRTVLVLPARLGWQPGSTSRGSGTGLKVGVKATVSGTASCVPYT
jgi:hypothetical protein